MLERTKADSDTVRSDSDIRTVVDGMVGNAASNALKSALDQKVSTENQYDDDNVRTLLSLIVNANPADPSALRTILDSLDGRVKSIESELDASCGDAVCAPGNYVKTACDPSNSVERVCDTCAAGTYSYGGLVAGCLDCSTCSEGFHEVAPCSALSNRVCAKCQQCAPGATYETSPCTATTDRVCTACLVCGVDQWVEDACSATSQCRSCTVCSGDLEFLSPCTPISDTVCQPRRAGFLADLSTSTALTTTGAWQTVTGFKTTDALAGTFVRDGTSFDGTTFTTPRDGFYFLAMNIRMDGMNGGYFHVNIIRNNVNDPNTQGLSTVRGSTNYDYWSFTTSGVVKAPANTKYNVKLLAQSDKQYTIHSFSGFTAFELFPEEGVFALPSADIKMTATGYQRITNWVTTKTNSFLEKGTFNGATGDYTVQEDGVFLLAFSARFDGVGSGYVRALIDINNKNELNAGLHAIQGSPFPGDYFVMHAQGAAMLKKGDVIAPKVFSSKDKDYIVNKQCQFSAVRLNTTYGFSADFVADVNIARKKVAQVTGAWRTNVTAGLFDKGNVFDEAAGMFTAPVDGELQRLAEDTNWSVSFKGLVAMMRNPDANFGSLCIRCKYPQLTQTHLLSLQLSIGSFL
eukprot:m.165934 g.165934  ORF g.165934 m.165934 type:complete len:631 (-) comp16608_c0_seq2:16-1908(-)